MKKLKYVLVLAMLAQSTPAYADHEEVIGTLLLELLTLVVLAVAIFAIRLNRIGKLLFAVICLSAIVLTFFACNAMPYHKYQTTINSLVTDVPLVVGFTTYYALRNRFGKKMR
jgi:uncharacterized membrane protein YhhN